MSIMLLLAMIAVVFTIGVITERKKKFVKTADTLQDRDKGTMTYPQDFVPSPDIPKGFFYHPDHTWAYPGLDGAVMVGLDDLYQKFTGKIDKIIVSKSEESGENGKLLEICVGDRMIKSSIPIKGGLHSINTDLINDPGKLLDRPYEDGWIVKILPANLLGSLKSFKTGSNASKWMKKEFEKLRETIPAVMNAEKPDCKTMADGGMLIYGVGRGLKYEEWRNITAQFFGNKK